MDSYVIRIYRRDAKNPGNIAGQVEFVEREETRSFGGADELMEILTGCKDRKWILKTGESKRPGSKKNRQRQSQ